MAKIRARALLAAYSLQRKGNRQPLTATFRKYYNVSMLDEKESERLAREALKCLAKRNVVGYRFYSWGTLLVIAALKAPKPEQLKAFEAVMSKVKPASTASIAFSAVSCG